MENRSVIILYMLVLIFLLGCATASKEGVHIAENYDFSYIKRVAVLPFDNLSDDRNAGEIIRNLVSSEFLASGLVEVAYPGDVIASLKKQNISEIKTITVAQMKQIAGELKVQALITGVVTEYGETGTLRVPRVTLTLTMIEADTGNIIWSVTKTGSQGPSRLVGKTVTLSEIAINTVRDAIKTLYEK